MNENLKVIISADTKDLEKNINKAEEEVKDFGEESEKASELVDEAFTSIGNSVKTAMAATTAVIAAAGAAIVGITESSREYRNAQTKLNTAFKSAGSNAETARKVYTKLNGVLGDSDVAVEAAAHLAKLTTNEEDLAKWTDVCTGVYATFGDSLPIEGLAEASNETAKTGKLTGGLTDALNWAGISEEDFQAKLDECTSEQERQNLILSTLTDTYSAASTEFQKANRDIIEANEATENWNNAMADVGAAFEPVITEFKNMGVEILKGAKEPLEDVAEFITDDLMPGIKTAAGWVKDNKEVVIGVITGMTGALVAHKAATVASKMAEEGLTVATVARTAAQKALNLVMNANPAALVATAVAGLTIGLVAYAEALEDSTLGVDVLTEAEKELIEQAADAGEKFRELKAANDDSAGALQAQMDHTSALADELMSLVDASGKVTEADQVRAQFILNELNEALGTEYEMIDGVIQNYVELKDSIYDVIQAKTANSMLEARNDEYVAAIESEGTALQAVIATQKDYEAQLEKATAAKKVADDYYKRAMESQSELDWADYSQKQLLYIEEKKILEGKKAKYDEASQNYADYYDTINEYEEASMLVQQGNYEDAIEILTNKGEAYFEYADDVSEATKKVIDTLYKEAVDAGIEAARTKENFENGVEGYTEEMVAEAEKAYEDALSEWENAYNDANGLGTDFGDGAKDGIFKSRVPLKFGLVYDDTLRTWRNAEDDGTDVGESLGDGVKKGLDNKESPLLSRARSLISNIWNAMKRAAESNSPSKKTMRLGEDMGAGLEIGLDDSTPDVVNSAREMIQKTIMPIEGALSWNNFGSIFDTSPLHTGTIHTQSNSQGIQSTELVNQLMSALSSSSTPIILQVDGKTWAKTSISTINQLTQQTGKLDLVLV